MKKTQLFLAAILGIGCVQYAMADAIYDFSYGYGTLAHTITGSITGTRNDNGTVADLSDDFINGITVLSTNYDGTAMTGPLYILAYNWTGYVGPIGTMSFKATDNNFLIMNCTDQVTCDALDADPDIDQSYFMMRTPGQGNPSTSVSFWKEPWNSGWNEGPVNEAGWSLTERSVGTVPEPGTVLLAGLGLGALVLMQRRSRAA